MPQPSTGTSLKGCPTALLLWGNSRYSTDLCPLHLTLLEDFILNPHPSLFYCFQHYWHITISLQEHVVATAALGARCCDKQRSCSGALLPENKHQAPSHPPSPQAPIFSHGLISASLCCCRLGFPCHLFFFNWGVHP